MPQGNVPSAALNPLKNIGWFSETLAQIWIQTVRLNQEKLEIFKYEFVCLEVKLRYIYLDW